MLRHIKAFILLSEWIISDGLVPFIIFSVFSKLWNGPTYVIYLIVLQVPMAIFLYTHKNIKNKIFLNSCFLFGGVTIVGIVYLIIKSTDIPSITDDLVLNVFYYASLVSIVMILSNIYDAPRKYKIAEDEIITNENFHFVASLIVITYGFCYSMNKFDPYDIDVGYFALFFAINTTMWANLQSRLDRNWDSKIDRYIVLVEDPTATIPQKEIVITIKSKYSTDEIEKAQRKALRRNQRLEDKKWDG